MATKRKKVFISLILLMFVPAALVLIAIQPFFIKSVILPRVETATDSKIEVGDLSLSPLKSLSLKDVHFTRNDKSVDAKITSVVLRYDLIKILKGTLWIDECSIISPDIVYRDVKSTPSNTEERSKDPQASTPQLHIRNLKITDGTFTLHQDGKVLKLEELTVTLPELINGNPVSPSIHTKILGFENDAAARPLMEGQLDVDATLGLSDTLLPVSFKGSADLDIGRNEAGIPPLSFKLDADLGMDLNKRTFSVNSLTANALQGASTLLALQMLNPTEIDLSQEAPRFSDTEMTLSVPKVNLSSLPFAEWIPLKSGTVSLESQVMVTGSGKKLVAQLHFDVEKIVLPVAGEENPLRLGKAQGKGSVTWTPGSDSGFDLELNAEDLQLSNGKKLPSPLKVLAKGTASSAEAEFSRLEFSWAETAGFQNRIHATGTADWRDPQALDIDMRLRAEKLDLNPWESWLVKASEMNTEPNADDPVRTKNQKLTLPQLPLKKASFSLKIQQIRLNQIDLENIQANLLADKTTLQLSPLSLNINGSAFTNIVDANWENLPLNLEITSSLTPLDLQPVIDTFLPEKAGSITGILKGNTRFQVSGSDMQELWDSFKGKVNISYTEGKIKLIDSNPDQHSALLHTRKLVQQIVQALAAALQIPSESLMAPDIESVIFKSQIENRKLVLEQARIINPEFMLDVSGQMALHPDIGTSTIEDLPVVLGVSTNIAKRVKIYREERVKENYVVLPSFIEVTGTLADPRVHVKKAVVTGLLISGVTERNKIGNENVQTGLEVLGSILTGEPVPVKTPVPGPTALPGGKPVPTPKPDKTERILEGIQIFRQLRTTPTPVPQ